MCVALMRKTTSRIQVCPGGRPSFMPIATQPVLHRARQGQHGSPQSKTQNTHVNIRSTDPPQPQTSACAFSALHDMVPSQTIADRHRAAVPILGREVEPATETNLSRRRGGANRKGEQGPRRTAALQRSAANQRAQIATDRQLFGLSRLLWRGDAMRRCDGLMIGCGRVEDGTRPGWDHGWGGN